MTSQAGLVLEVDVETVWVNAFSIRLGTPFALRPELITLDGQSDTHSRGFRFPADGGLHRTLTLRVLQA